MVVLITPRIVLRYLVGVVAVFAVMDALLVLSRFGFGTASIYGLSYLFDLDTEQNLPTLFSTLDLSFASILTMLLYREARHSRRADSGYWFGLSIIFGFLAVDEFCSLHERLTKPMQLLWHTTGALSYAWVIPYALLVTIFALAYGRFWWRLPVRSRILFALSAMVYVGGALGMETLEARFDSIFGFGRSLVSALLVLGEETMEMSGIAIFVFALLKILQQRPLAIQFVTDPAMQLNNELLHDAIASELRADALKKYAS